MMGQHTRSESLFYYFRIEDHIPDDHLLRLVARHIDFAFVRETFKASYSHTPFDRSRSSIADSIDWIPVRDHQRAPPGRRRWNAPGLTGLGFDQEVSHHSTFSKNRHGRFQESPLFLDLFE